MQELQPQRTQHLKCELTWEVVLQVVGGPAWLLLEKGDMIVEVDGVRVDDDDVQLALIGSDKPGSAVGIKVQRKGQGLVDVRVVRAESRDLADKRALMEVFTELENKIDDCMGSRSDQLEGEKMVSEAIAVWSKMQVAEAQRLADMRSGNESKRAICSSLVRALLTHVENLLHASSSAAVKHDECQLQLAEAQRRLKVEEEHSSEMADLLEECQSALCTLTADHQDIQRQLQEETEAHAKTSSKLKAAQEELKRSDSQRVLRQLQEETEAHAKTSSELRAAQDDLERSSRADRLRVQRLIQEEREAHAKTSSELKAAQEELERSDSQRVHRLLREETEAHAQTTSKLMAAQEELKQCGMQQQQQRTNSLVVEQLQAQLASLAESCEQAREQLKALQALHTAGHEEREERGNSGKQCNGRGANHEPSAAVGGAPKCELLGGGGKCAKERWPRQARLRVLPWMEPILREQQPPKCWLDVADCIPATRPGQLDSSCIGPARGGGGGEVAASSAALAAALELLDEIPQPSLARGRSSIRASRLAAGHDCRAPALEVGRGCRGFLAGVGVPGYNER